MSCSERLAHGPAPTPTSTKKSMVGNVTPQRGARHLRHKVKARADDEDCEDPAKPC